MALIGKQKMPCRNAPETGCDSEGCLEKSDGLKAHWGAKDLVEIAVPPSGDRILVLVGVEDPRGHILLSLLDDLSPDLGHSSEMLGQ